MAELGQELNRDDPGATTARLRPPAGCQDSALPRYRNGKIERRLPAGEPAHLFAELAP